MLIIMQLAKTAQQSGGGAAHPFILAGLQRYAEEHIVPVTAGFGALVHGLLNGPGANLAVHSAQIGNIENTFLLRCAGNCGKKKDKEWKKSFNDLQRYAFPDNPVRVVSKKK